MERCHLCGERASCAYSYGGGEETLACERHAPLTFQVASAASFTYRTIEPALTSTGHLGIAGPVHWGGG